MKDLCKVISTLVISVFMILTIFKIADRFLAKFRKNYITIDSEQIHV